MSLLENHSTRKYRELNAFTGSLVRMTFDNARTNEDYWKIRHKAGKETTHSYRGEV